MMPRSKPLIMIAAGGTGGHVFPGLSIAKQLMNQPINIMWVGTKIGLEATLVPDAGITLETIKIQGFRGKHWFVIITATVPSQRCFIADHIFIL